MEELLRTDGVGAGDEAEFVESIGAETGTKGKKRKRTRRAKPITVGAFLVMGLQLEDAQ